MKKQDKQEIIDWLDKHKVKKYTLISDDVYGYIVDVDGEVNLLRQNLHSINVKFNNVKGNFYCQMNKLTSLEGCPSYVGGDFNCSKNKIQTLEFCPNHVNGIFDCYDNKLIDLYFFPEIVDSNYLDFGKNIELGFIQDTHDFNIIYLEHKKIKIKELANSLEQKLNTDKVFGRKIKI